MKKLIMSIPLALILCFMVGCQDKGAMEELEAMKAQAEVEEQNKVLSEIFSEPLVLNGIFKGMKYPKFRSRNSSLYSKLIGSYELELDEVMKEVLDTDYKEIIDVGCAEGYYAVGLAMKFPNVNVLAYDIEAESRQLTKEMAELNGVGDRVIVGNSFTAETLSKHPMKDRTLLICDTEGFEKYLFTEESIKNLKNCDLIIETHDWVDINISTDLENLFKDSHDIQIVRSIGDNIKAKNYKFEELKDADLLTRYRVYEEGRRYTDEWLILRAK